MKTLQTLFAAPLLLAGTCFAPLAYAETLAEIGARLGKETAEAYDASRYMKLAADHFVHFTRDADATPREGEMAIGEGYRIVHAADAPALVALMAGHLAEFLAQGMQLAVPVEPLATEETTTPAKAIVLRVDPSVPGAPGSFRISVEAERVTIEGQDADGLRDGVVKLADRMGLRRAPFLETGVTLHEPRLRVRLGVTPRGGSVRDLVFLGYNAVFSGGGSLYALSQSDAIPELAVRRQPGLLESNTAQAAAARAYGLKTYAFIDTRQKFPEEDPVFAAHPDLRGARTWKADGEFVLCTEHPKMKQWLAESVQGLFKADPALDGIVLIIGGEGFYHCFMRPFGAEKGRTNCARCDALGAPDVVAGLINGMAEAARAVNPKAEVVAWPYSAEHVWSSDRAQTEFIQRLKPGAALFTEIEKDEYIDKADGVSKHLWDYSIDLIGPGERAAEQVRLCREAGIPIYMKSEPELAFEAPRLPHVPAMDRWAARAEALASCGADGAWVFPAFRSNYGTSATEINKHFWWTPTPDADELLGTFAARIAGKQGGPRLRRAWAYVSDAVTWMPELPPYYSGPYYLGPAHPMMVEKDADLPGVFDGHYLFHAEITDADGLKKSPTYFREPRGNVPVFAQHYRQMAALLDSAMREMDEARALLPEGDHLMFDAEYSAIAWFYRTALAHANFYESCLLRDKLTPLAGTTLEGAARDEAAADFARWRELLVEERANAEAALPLVQDDVRLDWYYGGDHTFPHAADMLRAKIDITAREINEVLPRLAAACGITLAE